MKRAGAGILGFVFCVMGVPSHSDGGSITITKITKTQMMGQWKVVVDGTISLNKGETYNGLTNAGIVNLNVCPNVFYPGTYVSITPPKLMCCGNFQNGSFEFYAITSVQSNNYVAGVTLSYSVNNQMKAAPGTKQFTIP